MAPRKIRPAGVELLESEVSKPPPLRIIKRSKTFGDSLSSQDSHRGRKFSSTSSLHSRGSPPAIDRPLTVRKKRQGGVSGTGDAPEDRQFDKENEQPLTAQTVLSPYAVEDPDVTPKALHRVSRTISAGNFVKSEFHRRDLAYDQGPYSMRNNRHSIFPTPPRNPHTSSPHRHAKDTPPKIPERRASKSKHFIFRALGRGSEEPKAIRPIKPKPSKNNLLRRPSRSSTLTSNNPPLKQKSNDDILNSMELNGLNISNVDHGPPPSSGVTPSLFNTPPPPLQQVIHILSPHAVITPEFRSVQNTTCTFWVAIEIRGELHDAGSRHDLHHSQRVSSAQMGQLQYHGSGLYGHMYAMIIDLHVGQGCCLLDVIGDLHIRRLRANETHLILAKIRLDNTNTAKSPSTRDPEILIADLENHLGDTLTHYLTVQVTFKHSGFTRWEINRASQEGTYLHSTSHQTEARAAINRHCPQSAWSPRLSQTYTDSTEPCLLNNLIKRHLPADAAMQALGIINRDRTSTPATRRHVRTNRLDRGSERGNEEEMPAIISVLQTPPSDRKYQQTSGSPFARLPYDHVRQFAEDEAGDESSESLDENDPARKIWATMREVSRGGYMRHPRKSVSADHYYNIDDSCSPGRASSTRSADGVYREHSSDSSDMDIKLKRHQIKEVALRNKRSVGTETLRSIAPSIARNVGRGKPGAVGLGLVAGRWGWASPWW